MCCLSSKQFTTIAKVFSWLNDGQIAAHLGTPIPHKKTRKRTATFSSGLLDIAAEDRRGFRLRRLARVWFVILIRFVASPIVAI